MWIQPRFSIGVFNRWGRTNNNLSVVGFFFLIFVLLLSGSGLLMIIIPVLNSLNIFVEAQQVAKYSYLSGQGIHCDCPTQSCMEMSCRTSSLHPTSNVYWVSPKLPILKSLTGSNHQCDADSLTFVSTQVIDLMVEFIVCWFLLLFIN